MTLKATHGPHGWLEFGQSLMDDITDEPSWSWLCVADVK